MPGPLIGAPFIGAPFIGAEAIAAGAVRKHRLRSHYEAVFPGVYLPRDITPSFRQRAEAAWLWSQRAGVLSGLTAARLHSAKWVDDALPIEINWSNGRPPSGIRVSRDRLADDEWSPLSRLPVTTVQRTAFDIGRRGRFGDAVARLDALGNATGIGAEAIAAIAQSHRGARGLRQLLRAVEFFDPGAQSPKETWLRLLVIRAGYPRPRTQIPVRGYYLDMGWEDVMIGLEYDGEQHRTDRAQFAKDIVRLEELADAGWTVLRVVAGTPPAEVIRRLQRAWASSKVR